MAVTAGQMLGRRRMLLMVPFAGIPILLALIFRFGDVSERPLSFAADHLLGGFIVSTVMPLVALVFGTAALGQEIEDGTAFYLLAKPLPRWQIVVSKLAVAAAATASVVVTTTAVSGAIILWGVDQQGLLSGFVVAVFAGSILYCCVFVALSVLTSRALITGLFYVFIWEGLLSGLFEGTRVLSVRQYTLGIADAMASVPTRVFEAELNGLTAVAFSLIIALIMVWLAVWRLERFETGEST